MQLISVTFILLTFVVRVARAEQTVEEKLTACMNNSVTLETQLQQKSIDNFQIKAMSSWIEYDKGISTVEEEEIAKKQVLINLNYRCINTVAYGHNNAHVIELDCKKAFTGPFNVVLNSPKRLNCLAICAYSKN